MVRFSGSYIAKFLHPYSQPRAWRETPCTRSGASRVQPASLSAHDAVAVQKTGVHLREHRSDLHVKWSFQPALTLALSAARLPCQLPARTRGPLALAPAAARLPCLRPPPTRGEPVTCAYAKRSTPSLETRAKNSGSSSGAFSPKTRASRKMRSPSSRRLSSPVRSVAITSPFST